MKTLLLLLFPFIVSAQVQEGQTCLFYCLNHVCNQKPAPAYINDFNCFMHDCQNIYDDGAVATIEQIRYFVSAEMDCSKLPFFPALAGRYSVMSDMRVNWGCEDEYRHAIVIEGYYIKDGDIIELIFYNPEYGKHETMTYEEWVNECPSFAITVKP